LENQCGRHWSFDGWDNTKKYRDRLLVVSRIGSHARLHLIDPVRCEKLAEAFSGPVRIQRAVDMRYGEQIFEVTVPLEGVDVDAPDLLEQAAARFHRRHEELYAYSVPGQEVVIVNARVAVVGALAVLAAGAGGAEHSASRPAARRRVWLGDWVEVPVHRMDALASSQEIKGPAIFESATTTVLVREGERVTVTANGWLDIRLG
jgi:N-methylhydantoinase A